MACQARVVVIELLLEAERALSFGLVDRAEQLYQQVADHDPRNSIAVVGLARVALERADDLGAYLLARRALAIDPENEAAQRLVARLEEVLRTRGDVVPDMPEVPTWPSRPSLVPPSMAARPPGRGGAQNRGVAAQPPAPSPPIPPAPSASPAGRRRSLLDRIRRR